MVFGILFFSLILILPFFPIFFRVLNRDAGIFLYIAESILTGKLPYKDLWDHKGPIIYYLDALSLALGGKFALWLFHFILLFAAAYLFYNILKINFKDNYVVSLSMLFFFLQVSTIFYEYNQVEFFAFFLQSVYIYVFLKNQDKLFSKAGVNIFLGFIAGLSFWLRANLIGFFSAGLIFLFFLSFIRKKFTGFIRTAFFQVSGFLTISTAIFAYFYYNNSLNFLIDQVFHYNLAYSNVSLLDRVSAAFDLFEVFRNGKTAFLAITGVIIALYKKSRLLKQSTVFMFILFAVEGMFVFVSGRSYLHYFYLLVIPFCYFLALFLSEFNKEFRFSRYYFIYFFLVAYVLFSFLKQTSGKILVNMASSNYSSLLQISEEIKRVSSKEDKILVWGAEAQIYSLSGRDSASRYFYQYALFTPNYASEAVDEFLSDITERKPVLIIDASFSTRKVFPLDPLKRKNFAIEKNYYIPEKLYDRFIALLEEDYYRYKQIGDMTIYKLKD